MINAPVTMKPPERSLNGLQLSDIIPELEEKETLRMTHVVCNMKKDDVDRLKYIQAVDLLNEEEDNLDFDKSLWDVHRVLRHRGEHKKVEIYVEFKDPNKRKQWVSLFAIALQDPIPILKYAKNKKLLGKSPFKILVNHCSGDAPSQLVKAFKTAGKPGDPKFKFEVQVRYRHRLTLVNRL